MVWSAVFVPQMLPASGATGAAQLTVATQNIGAANTDPLSSRAGTGRQRRRHRRGAGNRRSPPRGHRLTSLDAQYGYHARVSTVGLWSQWPMYGPEPFELGMDWARSFRVVVHHPQGDIAVYAVHLPSVRPGYTDRAGSGVADLAALVAADPAEQVLVMGDLNTATTDPTLSTLTGAAHRFPGGRQGRIRLHLAGDFPDHPAGSRARSRPDAGLRPGAAPPAAATTGPCWSGSTCSRRPAVRRVWSAVT